MSSPKMDTAEPSSSSEVMDNAVSGSDEKAEESSIGEAAAASDKEEPRPPAKRRLSSAANAVIEISDTESDDSDVCAVTSYQASADEVKRIRGEDYSTSSSSTSSDYSSDSESPWEDDSIVVDDRPQTKVVHSSLNPRANRMDDPKMNPNLKAQEVMDKLKTHWKELKDHSSEEITFTCDPFRVCLLHEFLENSEIINNIIDDMNTLDWSRKKMDLYEFHQTADLASLTWQRGIKGIYELLKSEVMSWVSEVTGLELTSVSASCSLYGPGDHLLVHDDLCGDRRVAFILYLAPWTPSDDSRTENGDHVHQVDVELCGWRESMGGALELLSRDERGRPRAVVRRVYPRNNMLAFFRVGHDSYHQNDDELRNIEEIRQQTNIVCLQNNNEFGNNEEIRQHTIDVCLQVGEVLSLELPRLSITGWFHGPPPPDGAPAPDPPPPHHNDPQPTHTDIVVLSQWVESTYMSPRVRGQVQAQVERESEVCLRDFLLQDRADALLQALDSADLPWEVAGPANQRSYWRVPDSWSSAQGAEHPVRATLRLLTSTAFARLLADCTDLNITKYTAIELQKWKAGCFTLLPPREHYQDSRLEAVLYLGVPARALCGGATTYAAPEDAGAPGDAAAEGALITLPPLHNALNLVYCDPGAAPFTKYLSKMTMPENDRFYILTATYTE